MDKFKEKPVKQKRTYSITMQNYKYYNKVCKDSVWLSGGRGEELTLIINLAAEIQGTSGG